MQDLEAKPVIQGNVREPFVGIPAARVFPAANRGAYGPVAATDLVFLRDDRIDGARYLGVPDDNRSVILPDIVTAVRGRGYALSVKGVGARAPLYGLSPLDFAFDAEFGGRAEEPGRLAGPRLVTGESWFGESPYGAQGKAPAVQALRISELAQGCSINGFYICPVLGLAEIPEDVAHDAAARFWYRRYRGPFLQEHRLVPSNVRLYHQSNLTLGQAPAAVLRAFQVTTPEALDAFIDAYIASGIAALTAYVRAMRPCPWGIHGLDFDNVWLDKDCLVAPDGTLHFADLEGLEWVLAGQDRTVEDRVRAQFDRNAYEFMYGLDVLHRERENLAGRRMTQEERREALIPRFEIALANDPFVRAEPSAAGLGLVVRPPFGECHEVFIRAIDRW